MKMKKYFNKVMAGVVVSASLLWLAGCGAASEQKPADANQNQNQNMNQGNMNNMDHSKMNMDSKENK